MKVSLCDWAHLFPAQTADEEPLVQLGTNREKVKEVEDIGLHPNPTRLCIRALSKPHYVLGLCPNPTMY